MTFASWLRGLARGNDRTKRSSGPAVAHTRHSSRRLTVDILEDRSVPSAAVDFAAAQTFPNGGSSPLSVGLGAVAVGDFDGDGHADLAVANVYSNNVGVLLGNGSGGFASPVAFDSGDSFPDSVAVGDFNNDGKADLAVANYGGYTGVLLGDGSGNFAPAVAFYSGGAGAASVAVGDFNNDGNADLAVANNYGANVGVHLGDGHGGFAPAVTFSSGGSTPESVAVGDFNNDGHADLAVGHSGSNTVGVLLGDGSGGFAPAATFSSGGSSARSVAVGDVNGDGNADLAVANRGSGNVGVLLGNGSGNFTPAVAFSSGGGAPFSVAVRDFNNDGKADLAVANAGSGNVGVLLGNGVGGFAPAVTFDSAGSLTVSVAVGDFNGDGKADLAVMANANSNQSSNTVSVLLNTTVTNQPPVASPEHYSLAEDAPLTVAAPEGVLANDTDYEFNALTAVYVSGPTNGTLTLNADGSFIYTPAANFFGTDSFTYKASDGTNFSDAVTVSFTVVNVNDAPAASDLSVTGAEDTIILGQVGGSDVLDGDPVSFVPVTVPQHGTVVLSADGSFRYTPNADFNGTDTFTFVGSDGELASAPATVTIVVTPVNDPPVNTVPVDQVAAEDVAKVISGFSVADVDGAGTLTVTLAAGHGTLTVYSGAASANGTVLSGNGTASVTLTGTQAQINATLGAASGLTYLGALNYSGLDTLTMTTTDAGGLSDTDAVAIQVLSAQQQADVLAAIIADLGDDGVLNGGQENALIKKLSFLSGPNGANTLQAFINQVNGLVHAGILTHDQGVALIDGATTIVASLQ